MAANVRVKKGNMVGIYKVLDPVGFAGVLPTAVIVKGDTNVGITVILPSPYRQS